MGWLKSFRGAPQKRPPLFCGASRGTKCVCHPHVRLSLHQWHLWAECSSSTNIRLVDLPTPFGVAQQSQRFQGALIAVEEMADGRARSARLFSGVHVFARIACVWTERVVSFGECSRRTMVYPPSHVGVPHQHQGPYCGNTKCVWDPARWPLPRRNRTGAW